MKSFWVAFCVAAWSVLTAWAVNVEGVVTLYNGESPLGTRVVFVAGYPPAQTDTAIATATGIFEISLVQGWYQVNYWRPGLAVYETGLLEFRTNQSLPPVTLLPPLEGALSGLIGPGDFQVTDSLYVPDGQTAVLQPGTHLYFNRNEPFYVSGHLTALGTAEDSILFSRRYSTGFEATWRGLTMMNPDEGAQLDYVIVEHATKVDYHHGGGLYYVGPPVTISHSTFRYNHADLGGGLYLEQCAATIDCCSFIGNTTNGGAGLALARTHSSINGCLFQDNAAYYTGGGLYAENHDSSSVSGCQFIGNSAFDGAGVAILSVPTRISACLFVGNYSSRASALLCNDANGALITRCTMTGSTGPLTSAFSSVSVFGGTPTISSIIISETSVRFGVMLSLAQNLTFRNSDVLVASGTEFGFTGSDSSQGPVGLGVLDTLNTHGDTCDSFGNIFLDPEFVNADSGDYHLNLWSPCIDAGDPYISPDPDGTVADIGAFYFSQLPAGDPATLPPSSFVLSNYPNPFNGVTQIHFALPRAGQADLHVYDVTGREVERLLSGSLSAGVHELAFDARGLSSGIYFYRLQSGDHSQIQKMVLMK